MFKDAVITAQGLELDAKILAGHASAIFTGIKIGDGAYAGTEDLTTFTAMRSIRQEFAISSVIIDNNTVRLRSVVNNTGITNGYYMSELGVFAQDPDKGEILYSIALGIKNKMDYQPSELDLPGASSTIDTLTVISNSKTATIKMGMGAAASAEDLEEVRQGKVDIEGGDISQTVIETLEPIDIKYPIPTVGEKVKTFLGKIITFMKNIKPLEADMVVYVATTGSDNTGDGTSAKPYKTIMYALGKIPKGLGGCTATVNVADGTYNEAVKIIGYNGGYIYLRRNGVQELNALCNIKNVQVEYCSSVSITGFNFINTEGTSVFANMCEFVNMAVCQSIVATVANEVSFNFDYVSVGRISGCRSLNHDKCLRSFSSNVSSLSWADDSSGNYGIFSDGGGRVAKANVFQPKGLVANDVTPGGSITVSNFGARIGTLSSDVTLYVATTGSDTTGNGTSSTPYKTISYAINSLPRDFAGYDATIIVSAGTYNEDVLFLGYGVNGTLTISLTGNVTVNSIYMENSNVIFRSSITSVARTLSTKYVLITNASSINAYSDVNITTTGYYQDGTTKISIYIIRQSSAYFSGNTTISGNTDTAVAISNTSNAYFYSTSGSGLGTGFSVSTGATLTVYSNGLSAALPTAVWTGGQIINSNGTQISNLITSGLYCTWGTLTSGYVRHGNLNGVAMVIVNIRVLVTTALTAGVVYSITGFPVSTLISVVPFSAHRAQVINTAWLESPGTLKVQFSTDISSGDSFFFGGTYLTNS